MLEGALVKTEVCTPDRGYCSSQDEFDLNDAPATESWATTAANLSALFGGTYTQTRARQMAEHALNRMMSQLGELDLLLNPPE